MGRRYYHLWQQITTFENLLLACRKATHRALDPCTHYLVLYEGTVQLKIEGRPNGEIQCGGW